MPAEWEPHEATWLAWPHNPEDWPGKFQAIPWLYAEIVRLLAAREHVHLLVQDEKEQRRATGILKRADANLDNVSFHQWPTDRVWTRDSGPIFVRNAQGRRRHHQLALQRLGQVPDWHLDDQIPGRVPSCYGLPQWQPPSISQASSARLVLEGGSIDTNGAGHPAHHRRMPAQRSAAAQPRRQPRATRAAPSTTISASSRSSGSAAASPATTPTATSTTSPASSARPPSSPPSSRIRTTPTTNRSPKISPASKPPAPLDGKQFTIVELPLPRPVVFRSQRLPASYANFYIANGLVLVPTFHDPNDRIALGHPGRALSRSRSHRHPCRRSRLGTRHPALHDATAAQRTQS